MKSCYMISESSFIISLLEFFELPIYMFLILALIFKNRYSKKEYILFFGIGIILLLVYYISTYAALLKAFVVALAVKNMNFNKILRTMCYSHLLSFIFINILFLAGLSDPGIMRRGYYSLGYTNANVAGGIIFTIVLLWISRKNVIQLKDMLIIVCVSVFSWVTINNRSICLLLIFTIALYLILKKVIVGKKSCSFLKFAICLFPLSLLSITILFACLYESNRFIHILDQVLNYRIYLNYYNLKSYGVPVLGQYAYFNSGEAIYNPVTDMYSTFNTVDCAYVILLIQMGIIGTLIYLFSYAKTISKAFLNNNLTLLVSIIVISIYGLVESNILEIWINFPILYLFSKDEKIENVK